MAPGGKEQGQEEDDHPETEQGKTKRKGKVTEQWWTEAGGGGVAAVKPSSGETLEDEVGTYTITQSVRVGHRPHSRRLRGADHWGLK